MAAFRSSRAASAAAPRAHRRPIRVICVMGVIVLPVACAAGDSAIKPFRPCLSETYQVPDHIGIAAAARIDEGRPVALLNGEVETSDPRLEGTALTERPAIWRLGSGLDDIEPLPMGDLDPLADVEASGIASNGSGTAIVEIGRAHV